MRVGGRKAGGAAGRGKQRASFFLLLLAACLAIMPLAAVATAGPALTLIEYRAALLKARALAVAARREQSPPASGAPATWARIVIALPLQVQVRMPSGGTVRVDNRPLARLLTESIDPYGRAAGTARRPRPGWPFLRLPARASIRLYRFVAAVDRLLAATAVPSAPIDRAGADQALRQVLARPEYQYRQRKPSLLERFFDWLGGELNRFFLWLARLLERWLPGSAHTPARADRLARLMVIGVVLLLAVLIARIILAILPNLRRLGRDKDAEPAGGELLVPQEPEALLAQAEREAAAGRYREALRLAYLATVARLDRAGVLPEDRSRTHWELLRDLGRVTRASSPAPGDGTPLPRASLVAALVPLTQRLDERLYGGRTTTVDDYQLCRAAHDQIERLLCAPA